MREWIANLESRERLFLGWGAAITAGLFFYLFVMQPLAKGVEQSEIQVKGKREQLQRIQAIAAEYRQLGPGTAGNTDASGHESLLSVVDKTGSQVGLKNTIKRLAPEGDGKVRVTLENAEFDKVVNWLNGLAKNNRMHVNSLSLHPNESPGLVNGNLLLERLD